MKDKLIAGIVWTALALGVAGFGMSVTNLTSSTHLLGNFNPTGGGTYLLQSSISASQNTIVLTSFTEPGSGIPYTMSYINTDIIYGTIAPSSGSSEFVSASGITQNVNGTATLTGVVRGLSRTPGTGGCVASSTLARAFPGQTQFILSNSPCFYSEYATLRNNQTFSAINTFTISPIVNDANSTSTAQLASRQFVLNTAIQGAGTSTETSMGIVQLATAAQVGAGTASSSTGAPLVIPNKYATTSPGTLCTGGTYKCIVAASLGKISQSFLDLTQFFNFTSLFATNASSTNATTTNFAVTSGNVAINGINWRFPATQGASSTAFCTDGSGSISFCMPEQVLYSNGNVNSTISSTAATTTMLTVAIPANTLSTNGVLRINSSWWGSGGTGACVVDTRFGTGAATTSLGSYTSVTAVNGFGRDSQTIMATSTTGEYGISSGITGTSPNSIGAMMPYTLSATTYLDFTVRPTASDPNDKCTLLGASIEVFRK